MNRCALTAPGSILELGAFPGGITERLIAHGHTVTAVDIAREPEWMARSAYVSYQQCDVRAFEPHQTYAGLVCDMNGDPLRTAYTAARCGAAIVSGGAIIHTIKLPSWDSWRATVAAVEDAFATAGIERVALKHAFFCGQELLWLGRKN